MSDPGWGSGSADELNALLTTLTGWVQRALPAPPSGHPGPECQWCPLCQLASVLRGEHPELTDRLVEASAAVSSAVSALLEASPYGSSAAEPEPTPEPSTQPAERADEVRARRPRPRPRIEPDDTAGPV